MKFLIILVILPAVFSTPVEENEGRSLPVVSTGTVGTNFAQQNAAAETHDKKNFGLNFSSDRGSSNQYSNTGVKAAATEAVAQYPQPTPFTPYPQYPQYPYPYYSYPYVPATYPQYYPQYPVTSYYGAPNVPSVAAGSDVQLPNVGAGSGAVVNPPQPLIRY